MKSSWPFQHVKLANSPVMMEAAWNLLRKNIKLTFWETFLKSNQVANSGSTVTTSLTVRMNPMRLTALTWAWETTTRELHPCPPCWLARQNIGLPTKLPSAVSMCQQLSIQWGELTRLTNNSLRISFLHWDGLSQGSLSLIWIRTQPWITWATKT